MANLPKIFTNLLLRNQLRWVKNFSNTRPLNRIISIKNDKEFVDKVMHSDTPVILNFHVHGCEPCRIMTPALTELIEPKSDIDLAIIDIDDHPELFHIFEVRAVPAILAFKNGLMVDKFIGIVDGNRIETLLSKLEKKKL